MLLLGFAKEQKAAIGEVHCPFGPAHSSMEFFKLAQRDYKIVEATIENLVVCHFDGPCLLCCLADWAASLGLRTAQ